MAYWVKDLSRSLRNHDSQLYAQETHMGRFDVYRKSKYGEHPPHFIFSLTDNWLPTGTPVAYGTEVVLNRIKALDLWRDDKIVEKLLQENEKIDESRERSFKNSVESFLYEFRSDFKKATGDINTANMKKLYRKEGSHGYCESGS